MAPTKNISSIALWIWEALFFISLENCHGFQVYNNISIALSVSKENKVVCFLLFILLFHLVGLWLSHLVACIEIKIQLKAGFFLFYFILFSPIVTNPLCRVLWHNESWQSFGPQHTARFQKASFCFAGTNFPELYMMYRIWLTSAGYCRQNDKSKWDIDRNWPKLLA